MRKVLFQCDFLSVDDIVAIMDGRIKIFNYAGFLQISIYLGLKI
jgi:hypothetical protein